MVAARRIGVGLVTAVLVAVSLVGCGDGKQTGASPSATPTSLPATPPTPTTAAVAAPDRDNDGMPDSIDPYPDDPTNSPSPTAPPPTVSPTPAPAWTPCDLTRDEYEGGCETDFIADTCDASYYSQKQGDLLDAYIENSIFVDEKRLKDCPQFLRTWKKAKTGFDDGSYEVGKEIKAGTYETTAHLTGGRVHDCYWERTTSSGRIIANDFVTVAKKIRVTVRRGELFTSDNCGNWVRV